MPGQCHCSAWFEHCQIGRIIACSDCQAVRQVGWHPLRSHGSQVFAECDSLQQLPDFRASQLLIQLRLPEQHNLQQLAFFCFQIGQQPQALDRFQWNSLGFIDTHHHAPSRLGMLQQTGLQHIQYLVTRRRGW